MTIGRKHARVNHSSSQNTRDLIGCMLDQAAELLDRVLRALDLNGEGKLIPVPVPVRTQPPQCPRSSDRRYGHLQP